MEQAKELTGKHVLAMVIAFFAVIIGANSWFITSALNTFPGEITAEPYLEGLAYNDVLERRAAQSALGWRAEITAVERAQSELRIGIAMRAASGEPVRQLRVSGVIKRAAHDAYDQEIVFAPMGEGVYEATVSDLDAGRWDLTANAEGGAGERFEFTATIEAPPLASRNLQ